MVLAVGTNVITVSGVISGTEPGTVTNAIDSAANYGGGWTDGSNQGSGFGAWTFNHSQGTGFAGTFIGDPALAGISGFGTNAFGFYANPPASGANAEVRRSFASAMPVGATFRFVTSCGMCQ